MELKRTVYVAMFLALAVILNIVESLVPIFASFVPGIKLGLTNIIILLVLYFYSFKEALLVSVLRVFVVGILVTGLFSISFFLSLSGAVLSIIMMYIAKKVTKLSIIGVSVIGSIFHTIGQILMAMLILKNTNIIYYLPVLLIFAIPTGIMIGIICKLMYNHLANILKYL